MTSKEVIVRSDEAETIDLMPDNVHHLLADGPATGGAISSHRVRLARGGNGAVPHRHDHSAEVFYVLDGRADLLADERIVTAGPGDLVCVPAGTAHAFAAARDHTADLLIILTPGIERFGYFRTLQQDRAAVRTPEMQERYDTHFLDSAVWADRLARWS